MDSPINNRLFFFRGAVCSAALLLAVSSGLAQTGGAAKPADEPVLKGPKVKERDVPGVTGSLGSGQAARRMGERIPPEAFREALAVLLADDAAAEIRASEEQETKIRAIGEEFRSAQRKYMADNREELIELRKSANLTGRGAQEVDRAIGRARPGDAQRARPQRDGAEPMEQPEAPMMDEAAQEKQDESRQRLRELMEGGPRMEDFYTRIWESLSVAQRAAVDAKLNVYREEQTKRREEAYVRQRVQERTPGDAAKPTEEMGDQAMKEGEPGAARPRAERPNASGAERRERLMRLFEKLSPEQQENLLARLEGAVRDGALGSGGAGAPGRTRGQRGPANGDKPAPSMDGVEVPDAKDVERAEKPAPRRRAPD